MWNLGALKRWHRLARRRTIAQLVPGSSHERGSCLLSCLDRRRAVGVERIDGLQAPRLTFFALGLGPANRLPVWRQNQPRSGVSYLHAIASGLVDIQEKGLLDGVLVWPGFDVHAIFQANVRGQKDFFAAVDRIGEVMKAPAGPGVVARVGEVVAFVRARHPHGG